MYKRIFSRFDIWLLRKSTCLSRRRRRFVSRWARSKCDAGEREEHRLVAQLRFEKLQVFDLIYAQERAGGGRIRQFVRLRQYRRRGGGQRRHVEHCHSLLLLMLQLLLLQLLLLLSETRLTEFAETLLFYPAEVFEMMMRVDEGRRRWRLRIGRVRERVRGKRVGGQLAAIGPVEFDEAFALFLSEQFYRRASKIAASVKNNKFKKRHERTVFI